MKISKFTPGEDKTCNIYIIGEEGEPCVIIDPGTNDNDFLDRYVDKHHGGKILGILLTHGHYDHISGLASLKHDAPVMCHSEEADFLVEPHYNGTGWHNELEDIVLNNIEPYLLSDEDEIKLGNYIFKVIHTPFHTRGSVCYYVKEEKALFSGDTLFHLTVGRTDLPTGSNRTVDSSLRKLIDIPDDVKVYPGHGVASTIGIEKTHNLFLRRIH